VVEAAFPSTDVRLDDAGEARAAVLVGIIERAGEAHLLLTRRALGLARDPGLVALPGGFIEEGEHPVDAVLREADEEIGLHPGFVALRCTLGTLERPRTGLSVVAYLGIVADGCVLDASVDEVHEIFEVPLRSLLAEGAGWQEEWGIGDEQRVLSFFTNPEVLGNNLVWGLTAAFIWRLLDGIAVAMRDELS
jgi:ADP-ribose pyrophosphatase YjhB (NUDIX family)